jgi:hypothetical protein
MSAVSNPYVSARLVPDYSQASLQNPRVLLIGSIPIAKNAIFTGANRYAYLKLSPSISYETYADADMANLIGTGDLYWSWKAAKEASGGTVPIDLLLCKNVTASTATTKITFSAATKNGTLTVNPYDAYRFFSSIQCTSATTGAIIATSVANSLNAEIVKPYAATAAAAELTLTWVDNFNNASIPVHVTSTDPTYTATLVNAGAATPDQPLSDVFDIIGDTKYTHYLWPDYFAASIQFLNTHLDGRFNEFNQVRSAGGWTVWTDTRVNLLTATSTLNTQHLIIASANKINGLFGASVGADNPRAPNVNIAAIATTHALMLTSDADISNLGYVADGLKDYTGGAHMASFPVHNIKVKNTVPANPSWYFTHAEQKQLNDAGISTYGVNRTGTQNITGNFLTLWKTDAAGNVNKTWQQVEFLYTSFYVREWAFSSLKTRLANTRMTNGELVSGYSMVNKEAVEEMAVLIYRELGTMALCTSGTEAEKKFRAKLFVELNPKETKVTINATYEIVSHVGTIDHTMRITTNYTGV